MMALWFGLSSKELKIRFTHQMIDTFTKTWSIFLYLRELEILLSIGTLTTLLTTPTYFLGRLWNRKPSMHKWTKPNTNKCPM